MPGAFGVVADVHGNSVSLAVTTPTQLVTLTDSNGAATSFTPTGRTVLATAADERGVPRRRPRADLDPGPVGLLRTPAPGGTVALGGTVSGHGVRRTHRCDVDSVQAKLGSGAFVAATRRATSGPPPSRPPA